jgi:hypothetical protein
MSPDDLMVFLKQSKYPIALSLSGVIPRQSDTACLPESLTHIDPVISRRLAIEIEMEI